MKIPDISGMKCPHCLDSFRAQPQYTDIGSDTDYEWKLKWEKCPGCNKFIIFLTQQNKSIGMPQNTLLVYPKSISRTPLSKDVPDKFAKDYKEACLVFAYSNNASAALSRRCLQNILRDRAGVKHSNLSNEIEEVIASNQLPSYLSKNVDSIRNIGNFAAHPTKSTSSGKIIDVEEGEAEWLLDVLEDLFNFYFVQVAESNRKRDALNKKLEEAGKPPMK